MEKIRELLFFVGGQLFRAKQRGTGKGFWLPFRDGLSLHVACSLHEHLVIDPIKAGEFVEEHGRRLLKFVIFELAKVGIRNSGRDRPGTVGCDRLQSFVGI